MTSESDNITALSIAAFCSALQAFIQSRLASQPEHHFKYHLPLVGYKIKREDTIKVLLCIYTIHYIAKGFRSPAFAHI